MGVVEVERSVVAALDGRRRQIRDERLADADRSRAGAAAAVRRREGLVQVRVDDVDAHVAGAGDADEGVEVGAVAVEIRAFRVEDVGHARDLGLEHAEGVRNGDHQRGDVFGRPRLRAWSRSTVPRLFDFSSLDLVAGESRRRRVGAVRGVGDEDVLPGVAALRQRLVHHQDAGQLAVRAGDRLQRHARHAEDLLQRLLDVSRAARGCPAPGARPAADASSAKPGVRAISSLMRGLCFIVHEPSG